MTAMIHFLVFPLVFLAKITKFRASPFLLFPYTVCKNTWPLAGSRHACGVTCKKQMYIVLTAEQTQL